MKATLTFTLPEEQEEHATALAGSEYRCALDDIRDVLRKRRKYDQCQTAEELVTAIEEVLSNLPEVP